VPASLRRGYGRPIAPGGAPVPRFAKRGKQCSGRVKSRARRWWHLRATTSPWGAVRSTASRRVRPWCHGASCP